MENVLHPLANRGVDFLWARFPLNPQYPVHTGTDETRAVRSLLNLDARGTDYYLLGPLFALLAHPTVLESLADPEELRDLIYYPVPATTWVNASLVGGSAGAAQMSRVPTVWPVGLGHRLTYVTDQAGILTDGHTSWTVTVTLGASGKLRVDWPGEFNAGQASIEVGGVWTAGSEIEFVHHPGGYPYGEVEKKLAGLRDTNQLLLHWGLAAAWQAARSPMERVALVAAALIKQRRADD